MLQDVIDALTEILIKEDFKIKEGQKEEVYIISKMDLIKFCIKLIKTIYEIDEDM